MSWATRVLSLLFGRTHDSPPTDTSGHPDLNALSKAIGYPIRRRALFVQALLHRSYHQQGQDVSLSNERLEFLGDAVLNLVVAKYLYAEFPRAHEGELTKLRSRLVNKRALMAYANRIRLSRFILMSQSAAQSAGKGLDTIISDTFEAIIAAIYLDGGFAAAQRFVERQVLAAMKSGLVATADENYKSMLLEYAQAKGLGIPRYQILREEGPDHDRTFVVEVLLNNDRKGSGSGKNKKEAEQAAASAALQNLL
jgi:ribonuclease-3